MLKNLNQAYIDSKIKKAVQKFGLSGTKSSADSTLRLPPGQYLTTSFPILDLGVRPPLALTDFTLKISGKVSKPITVTAQELLSLPAIEIKKDFHCVTKWSKYDVSWRGVSFEDILKLANPLDSAAYVIAYGRDEYSTNISIGDLLWPGAILAYELEGEEIPLVHGGPVRLVVPHLYGWKSAKFLNELKFIDTDTPGFWEVRGYHNRGDPWKEERYA